MSMEILAHTVELDLGWIGGLIINNPFNLFMLALLYVFAFASGKQSFAGFIKFSALFIGVSALMQLLGFPFLATTIPVLYMAIAIFLDSFSKESFVKRNMLKINLAMLFGTGFMLAGA